MSERLAIAIPFHARLDYLAEAVASVRAQTDADWTLFVVDDSLAQRGARELVERTGDARVRYLANERNLGMVACWNRCLAEAGGELVTLVHGDDRLLPGYVACMKRLARAHPDVVAFFCDSTTIDGSGRRRFSLQDDIKRFLVPRRGERKDEVVLAGEPGLRALMRGNFIVCPTLCWRMAVLGARRFAPEWRQVQDLELLARLLLDGATLVGAREKAYAYRRHAANATARQTEDLSRFDEEVRVFDLIAAQCEARAWPRAARTAHDKTIVRLHLCWRALGAFVRLRPAEARRYAAFLRERAR